MLSIYYNNQCVRMKVSYIVAAMVPACTAFCQSCVCKACLMSTAAMVRQSDRSKAQPFRISRTQRHALAMHGLSRVLVNSALWHLHLAEGPSLLPVPQVKPGSDGLQAFLHQLEGVVGRDINNVNFVFRCRCPDTGELRRQRQMCNCSPSSLSYARGLHVFCMTAL